jgi:thymidylate synthase (FAD)
MEIIEQDINIVSNHTKRVTSASLEEVLYETLPVLDHGFVRVIDYMGDDLAVVQAARVSYGKGTKKTSQDRGLIHYLMRHRHTTPFEMCELKIHVKLPIFVARQWVRHRTASINEYSARYSILSKEFYLPSPEHLAAQSKSNRQGREDESVSDEDAERILSILKDDALRCYDNYIDLLNQDEAGNILNPDNICLSRELARMNLNLNYYTEWYWKTNLHNLLHFISLRADSHAQYEIRVYADLLMDIVRRWVPISFEAFEEYRLKGASFSGNALKLIKALISGHEVKFEDSGMTKREWEEVQKILYSE